MHAVTCTSIYLSFNFLFIVDLLSYYFSICFFFVIVPAAHHGTHSHLSALADHHSDDSEKKHGHGHSHGHGGPTVLDAESGDRGGPDSAASNMNMRGVWLHVMADALGSVVVIISALVMWKTDWEYKNLVDPGKNGISIPLSVHHFFLSRLTFLPPLYLNNWPRNAGLVSSSFYCFTRFFPWFSSPTSPSLICFFTR